MKTANKMLSKIKKAICLVLSLALLLSAFSGCISNNAEYAIAMEGKQLIINEAMSTNETTITDASGSYSDWIELYNPSERSISLNGYALSDNEEKPRKWVFPDNAKIGPGEYMLIFCSGSDKTMDGQLHTSFGISSKGETVILSDASGEVISRLVVPAMPTDVSCGYANGDTSAVVYYSEPTPGAANSENYANDLSKLTFDTYPLYINEYTISNNFYLYDSDGDCPSWVEIYNYGDEPVPLSGMYLSDNAENPGKWDFPAGITIAPGEYKLVFLSGKDKPYDGYELHADFKLSNDDTVIMLCDSKLHTIDSVDIAALDTNASCGRDMTDNTKWVYYARPTPGKANTTHAYDNLADSTSLSVRQVWINEVMSVSGSDRVCDYQSDWVEIFNGSDEPINLTGYSLSDSNTNLDKYKFDNVTIESGEYLTLYASGQEPTEADPYQMPFKLSNTGETLYLVRDDGTLCDMFNTGRQFNGISSGREGTVDDARLFFLSPTPGAANINGLSGYTVMPEFSVDDIYVNSGDMIELTASGDVEIRYTTDGSDPTNTSQLYTAPIRITKNVTIRAAAFADQLICGGISTHTYLTDIRHDLAVVCLSTDSDNLFDYNTGIYADGPGKGSTFPYTGANYWKNWERPIHLEFYENDGSYGIGFDAGIRIFGQYSRAVDQKSMSIHLREAYGQSEIHYPFFEDNDVTEYHDLLLRSSGQDWNLSKLRDGLIHKIVKGQMDVDIMDYRPVAVYINGEYWGLYNLRDKVNEDYLYTHNGVDPDNVDIIKGSKTVLSGDKVAYEEMLKYVNTHDLSNDEYYDYVCSIVDVDEIINYWIIETFYCNTDTGNIKYYKERTEDSKWRAILFDLDWGLTRSTYQWNMIEEAFNPAGHGIGKMFSTELMCALKRNPEFKQKFIETYAYHLNTTFSYERTSAILDEMAANIESEIPYQYERWGAPSVNTWQSQINFLHTALEKRVEYSKRDLKAFFNLSNEEMDELFPQGW